MESMSAPDMTGSYCTERRKNEKARDFVRKKLRDSGNPYINRQNISVPGKTPSNVARVCRCSYSCGNITVEDKFRWFHEYYTMDFNGQSEFLASKCMRLMDVKRKRREMSSRRQCSVAYFLPDAEKEPTATDQTEKLRCSGSREGSPIISLPKSSPCEGAGEGPKSNMLGLSNIIFR
ncbi:hypothetical protein GE061_012811 [Apolygus lucorum]|uniref:Uncharacterized protein n=1 Tax=Apolygus lucorum TaxID=248454 RepID=A0A8S9XUQ3_APOLU|nr:hypothetical protein GE061_012811 [Apolygus lucorum]